MLEFDDIQHILLTRTPAITGRYEFLSFGTPEGGRAWLTELLDKVQSASDAQAKRNQQWQDNTFGDLTNPLYIILQPDPSGAEENGKLKGVERGRYSGLINNADDFVKFLQPPGPVAAK